MPYADRRDTRFGSTYCPLEFGFRTYSYNVLVRLKRTEGHGASAECISSAKRNGIRESVHPMNPRRRRCPSHRRAKVIDVVDPRTGFSGSTTAYHAEFHRLAKGMPEGRQPLLGPGSFNRQDNAQILFEESLEARVVGRTRIRAAMAIVAVGAKLGPVTVRGALDHQLGM